ncbi:MAG: GNAT family N-acetyltransferase [Bifidobacteriaceae bacterium]|jgi:ribosomal-protein-alanine N-acetyltransferase|nr:GNAT family N-acetyltransferase [Bifidobacteriaceae bacterium]
MPALTLGDIRLVPLNWVNGVKLAEVHERNRQWIGTWEATDDSARPVRSRSGAVRAYLGYVTRSRREAAAGTCLPWVIEVGGQVVGHVVIGHITGPGSHSGTLGYWVDERHAGRGIVPAAAAMAFDYAVGPAGLHRVEAAIHPDNQRSLAVVAKLGFRDEGIRARYLLVAGEWTDHRIYALTKEEVPEGLVHRWQSRHQGGEDRVGGT